MSGTQVSAWQTPNELLTSMQTPAIVLHNQLANQGAQQELNAAEMEQISRASNWVISQDPENKDPARQAQAYSTAVRLLRANNYAKNAPDAYPGFEHMQLFARMGTPSKDLYQQTQDSAWANANRIGGGPLAAPGATAPPAEGGSGDFSPDKETARRQIVARETGGEANPATALNYVARADPTAYARGATASGKYQFVNSTWREGMQLAGLDPAKYATARDAPEAVQDQVFDAVYAKYGTKPWQKGPKDWVKDEQGRYQLATVRPPPGSPGGAPVTAAAAAPGGGVVARNPGAVQVAGPGAGAPAASTVPLVSAPSAAAAAAQPAPVTTTEPETGLPVLSAPQNQVMPGQPNGPPRPLTASEQATIEAQRTGRPAPVSDRPGFWATPDGTLTTAPGREATAAPAAPAATAPAAPPPPAAPQQPPFSRPTPVNPATHLTTAQEQELNGLLPMASRSREGQAAWVARKQQMIQQNDADQHQYETSVNTWQTQQREAADSAERIRLAQQTAQREQETATRTAADTAERLRLERESAAALAEQRRIENQRQKESAERDAQRLAQGSTQADKDTYTLTHEDPSSQQYAEAWSRKKWEVAPNGNVIEKDVSEYRAPTRSIQRPSFVPAPTPQGLDEVRKADTDAKVITSAIDHYIDVFTATGGNNWGAYFDNPQDPKSQQLIGAYNRMKTVLRSPVYYNTGVLQPAEIKLLGQDLLDPGSIRGLFATPQALATRLNEIRLAILTRQDAELRSVGKNGVIVRDKADYAQVPDGGRYYDEEGNLRIKPGAK